MRRSIMILLAVGLIATASVSAANIIDGADDRGPLLALGPSLGLSPAEMARIRKVSGYVGCFLPSPSLGTGALYLTNGQILTAAHIFFEPSGRKRSKCFFKNQDPEPVTIDLLLDAGNARFGAATPKAGSNNDYAIVRLAEPVPDADPFPLALEVPVRTGDRLIVVTAHPAEMERQVDNGMPVVQGCKVLRVPVSSGRTSFFRSDCDATGSSSGGMNLSRVDGELAFRGVVISTGLWRDPSMKGAPYDEKAGSVTTSLGTDAAILEAGKALAVMERF
ncbi:MAG: trypsin-like peptidase domain-containing protein [Bauldia sp.]|nr:MAG: trypsin-like peptidase domain-containing protein [Bauldia sp.]